MNQIERISLAMDQEPDRYTRARMAAVLRETLNRMERIQNQEER